MGQRNIVLHHLVFAEQPAMGPARHRTLTHDVQGPLRLPEPSHRMVDSPAAQTLLGKQESPTARPTDVARHPAVGEHHLGVVASRGPNSGSGWAIVGISRTICTPGVSVGTTKIEACSAAAQPGLCFSDHQNDVGAGRVRGKPLVCR